MATLWHSPNTSPSVVVATIATFNLPYTIWYKALINKLVNRAFVHTPVFVFHVRSSSLLPYPVDSLAEPRHCCSSFQSFIRIIAQLTRTQLLLFTLTFNQFQPRGGKHIKQHTHFFHNVVLHHVVFQHNSKWTGTRQFQSRFHSYQTSEEVWNERTQRSRHKNAALMRWSFADKVRSFEANTVSQPTRVVNPRGSS